MDMRHRATARKAEHAPLQRGVQNRGGEQSRDTGQAIDEAWHVYCVPRPAAPDEVDNPLLSRLLVHAQLLAETPDADGLQSGSDLNVFMSVVMVV